MPGVEAPGDSIAPAAGTIGTMAGGMTGALAVGSGAAAAIAAMTGGDPEAGGAAVGFSGISRRMLPKAAVAAQPRPQTPKMV